MARCDHCDSELTPAEAAERICPHCGAVLALPGAETNASPLDGATLALDAGDDSGELDDLSFETDEPLSDAESAAADAEDAAADDDDPDRTIAVAGDDATMAFDSTGDLTAPPFGQDATVDSGGSPAEPGGMSSDADPNAATIDHSSSRFDSGSDASGRHGHTPSPRHLSGLSSQDGGSAEDRGSESIKPGDFYSMGTENVRLRSHSLGAGGGRTRSEAAKLDDVMDYRFVEGPFAGGMGEVWKARQATLDRNVAVKRIKNEKAQQDRDREKFVSEAVITGQLEHPNIIPVHDLGLAGDGLPFYSMKFVEGSDWEDQIDALTEAENLAILLQVSQAIAFAHSKDIIHMDLKPGNVRLGGFGEVLVMDWGLAARLDAGREIQPGGTPMYMPPELALPFVERWAKLKNPDDADAEARRLARHIPPGKHSDIYLLGALLFRIVAGCPPHRGKNSFDVLKNAARNKIVRVRRSGELLDIAYRAMATDPLERYAEVTDFIDAIRDYQSHAQSVQIAKNASRELRTAENLRNEGSSDIKQAYESYARARHGYENALELWPGNDKARRRLVKTRRVYAETAYGAGDLDLALSLLDDDSADDAELREAVVTSQRRRASREAWYKTLQYATAGSLAAALVFIGVSFYYGNLAHQQVRVADAATERAKQATANAETATAQAADAERRSEQAAVALAQAERLSEQRTAEAAEAEERATAAAAEADQAQAVAEAKTREAARAAEQADAQRRRAEGLRREAEEQRYFAAVGEIRATLADDGAYAASLALEKAAADLPAEVADRLEWKRLRRLCDWRREASELIPAAGEGRPAVVAAAPDGKRIVVASALAAGTELAVYASPDGERPQRRLTIPMRVDAIALSPGGRLAATLGQRLAVWDLEAGRELDLPNDAEGASAVAFSPSGTELLLGGDDTRVETWSVDLGAGRLAATASDRRWHRVAVTCVGYSPDGALRFSADRDGVVRVWSVGDDAGRRWSYRHDLAASGSPQVTAVAMSPTGDRLAYGCADGAVYQLAGGWANDDEADASAPVRWAETRPERLPGPHLAAVNAVAFAAEGEAIVSAGGDAVFVRPAPGSAVNGNRWKRERRLHDQRLAGAAVAGTVGYSGDVAGRVVRWRVDAEADELVFAPRRDEPTAGVVVARVDPATGATVVADRAGFVRRWSDPRGGRPGERFVAGHDDHRGFRAWAFGRDASRVLTVSADDRACVWDTATADELRSLELGDRDVVALGPAGVLVAASERARLPGGEPGAVAISLDSGVTRPLWAAGPRVACVEPLDADASRVAVGLRDGQVYLWTADRGRVELTPSVVRPHWRPIRSMAFDAASGSLLVGDYSGVVSQWRLDAEGGELLWSEALDNAAPVTELQWSSGRALAVQRWGGRVALAELEGERFTTVSVREVDPVSACLVDGVIIAATGDGRLYRRSAGGRWLADPRTDALRRGLPAGEAVEGLRIGPGGALVAYGRGFAEVLRAGAGGPVVSAVRSRTPAVAVLAEAGGRLDVVNAAGWVNAYGPDAAAQRRLPVAGEVVASRDLEPAGRMLLVVRRAGMTAVEEWDIQAGRRVAVLAELVRGGFGAVDVEDPIAAIGYARDGVARVRVLPPNGGAAGAEARFAAAEPPRSVAVSADGRRVAAAFADGHAELALRRGDGGWTVSPLDTPGVASIEFAPAGDRLLVGLETGQVFALGLETDAEGRVLDARRLLTMTGHGGAVTLLDFAERGDSAALVSGDSRGRVLVRPF